MRKIFQIGFNRCGTTSLAKFFEANGLRSVHWKVRSGKHEGRNLALLGHENLWDKSKRIFDGAEEFDFYSDMEFVSSHLVTNLYEKFEVIDQHYPESKFILNLRKEEDWIISRLHHGTRPNRSVYVKRWLDYLQCGEADLIEFWRAHYKNHCNRVLDYFSGKPDQLLVYRLGETSVESLEKFLPEINFTVKTIEKGNIGFRRGE